MEAHKPQAGKTRRTRIRISSSEKLTVWRVPPATDNLALECPRCGEKVFWIERDEGPDVVTYEETNVND
jgi:hypothetical protein